MLPHKCHSNSAKWTKHLGEPSSLIFYLDMICWASLMAQLLVLPKPSCNLVLQHLSPTLSASYGNDKIISFSMPFLHQSHGLLLHLSPLQHLLMKHGRIWRPLLQTDHEPECLVYVIFWWRQRRVLNPLLNICSYQNHYWWSCSHGLSS